MDGSTFSPSQVSKVDAVAAPAVMKPSKAFAAAFVVMATVLAGCATSLGAKSADILPAGQSARVDEGTVVAVKAYAADAAAPKQSAFAYTIRLTSGELVAIAQADGYAIPSGSSVLVEHGEHARVVRQGGPSLT